MFRALVASLILCGTLCFTADAQTSPTAPAALPVLIIQSTPGGAQVYVDDEVIGTTSQQGRLRISTLKPGRHTLRVALGGTSYGEGQFTLVAGKSLTKVVTLGEQVSAASASAGGPSLADTLNWIKDTLQNDPGSGFTYAVNATLVSPAPGIGGNYYHGYDFRYSLPQGNGCQLVLLSKESLSSYSASSNAYGSADASSSLLRNTTYSENLSELDPKGVTVQAGQSSTLETTATVYTASMTGDPTYSALQLKTTDDKPAIHLTMVQSNYVFVQNGKTQPQPDTTTNSTVASLTIQVRDPNVASRLANAFKHAIEVCGGKASAF
jgi:hypothetical protein